MGRVRESLAALRWIWARARRWCIGAASLLIIALSSLLFFTPFGCLPVPDGNSAPLPEPQRIVRVRLLESRSQVTLSGGGSITSFTTTDPTPRSLAMSRGAPMPLVLGPDGAWRLGGIYLGTGELFIRPALDGSLFIGDRNYHGQYRFVQVAAGLFDVVNDVDLDDYLKGVLAQELYASWQPETYKAQAIVARTYALYEKNTPRPPRHWDLNPDQRSQVYGGIKAETDKSRQAVDATTGVVVAAGPVGDERIIKAYFSSCCGGVSMSAADVMGDAPSAALSAQAVGNTCSASPKFNWGPVVVSKDELTQRFRAWGAAKMRPERNMGRIQRIDIAAVNPFNRPTRYAVRDIGRNRYDLSAEELRWAVNTNAQEGSTLYSGFIEKIINESDKIRFVGGHGSGHGVGMCQWCAESRARAGMTHEDIIKLAYPQTRLVKAY